MQMSKLVYQRVERNQEFRNVNLGSSERRPMSNWKTIQNILVELKIMDTLILMEVEEVGMAILMMDL